MENNNNKKQSKFSQVMNAQLPHHLTALMIMVAFVSFIAIGFNQESYSITQEELGDTFTTITASHANYKRIYGFSGLTSGITEENAGSSDMFPSPEVTVPFSVPYMETAGGIQVFCFDKSGDIPTDETNAVSYMKSQAKADPGIAYILSQHGKHGLNKYAETWITQVAIWEYQYEKDNTVNNMGTYIKYVKNDKVLAVCSSTNVCGDDYKEPAIDGLYANYIQPLINNAKNATSSSLAITKASGDLTVTDNSYYKSQLMTVSGLTVGSTYSISLVNAPSGTKVYKNDGTEITDLNNVPSGYNQFYLLVPINKVTEKTKNLTVSVTGPSMTTYIYEPTTTPVDANTHYQSLVVPVEEVVNTGVDLTYAPNVPDTGMSTTQSVYFIGLVILLCGIGIIYANAKPRKSE